MQHTGQNALYYAFYLIKLALNGYAALDEDGKIAANAVPGGLPYEPSGAVTVHDADPGAHWAAMAAKADLGLDGFVLPEQLPPLAYEPSGAVAAHNAAEDAHAALFAALIAEQARTAAEVEGIKHNLYDPITGNPHTYTFDSLTGIKVVSGVWNKDKARLEC